MDRMYVTFRRHRLQGRQPKPYDTTRLNRGGPRTGSGTGTTSLHGTDNVSPAAKWPLRIGGGGVGYDTNNTGGGNGGGSAYGGGGFGGGGGGVHIHTIRDIQSRTEDTDRFYGSTDFSRYKSSSEEDNESDWDRDDMDDGDNGSGFGNSRSKRSNKNKESNQVRRSGRRIGEGQSTGTTGATSRLNRLKKRAERNNDDRNNREIIDSDEESIVDTDEENIIDMYGSDEENERTARRKLNKKPSVKGTRPPNRKNRMKSSYADFDQNSEDEIPESGSSSGPNSSSSSSGIARSSESNPVKRKQKTINPGRWTVPVGTEIDREWLQIEEQNEQQYCPQVGDSVVYFPQGHSALLSEFPARDRLLPWNSFNDRWPVVHCEVKDIIFEFPPATELRRCNSVVATITLLILKTPEKWKLIPSTGTMQVEFITPRVTRHKDKIDQTFVVSIRNWDDVPDFIIPYYMFSRSLNCSWRAGKEIIASYKASDAEIENGISIVTYRGRIRTLSQSQIEWPQSPWESLEVLWDTGEEQRLGPWEAFLVDNSINFTAESKKNPHVKILSTTPAPTIDISEAERIEREIGILMTDEEELYGPFEFAVDSEVFPDYYSTVRNCTYVTS